MAQRFHSKGTYMKKSIVLLLLCIGSALYASKPKVCCFSSLTAFGDGYSDIGNAPPLTLPYSPITMAPDYSPGTNPGGLMWVQYVASNLCFSIAASSKGGTDYAVAVQTTSEMLSTVQNYVQTTNCCTIANSLFSLWSGAQDFANLQGAPPAVIPPNSIAPAVSTAVSNIVQSVATLASAGAQYIMVIKTPNLSHSPGVTYLKNFFGVDNTGGFDFANELFAMELSAALNPLCTDVLQLDLCGLISEVLADPVPFGFTNVTESCACPNPPGDCSTDSGVCPGYFYWDFQYYTNAGNKLFGDYVKSIFNGVNCFAGLSEVPLGAIFAHNVTIRQQLPPIRQSQDLKVPYVFVGANYSPILKRPNPKCCYQSGQKAQSFTFAPGFIFPIYCNWILGASYGFTRPQSKGSCCCQFLNNMHTASAFTSYFNDCFYVNGIINGSFTNFSVQRHFNLLEKATTACGNTNGNQLGVIGEGCYYFIQNDRIKGGIIADVEYNRIKTFGYSESGAVSANLTYNDRTRHSIITGIGLQATYQDNYCFGDLLINFFALGNKDWKAAQSDVKFHVTNMLGSHAKLPVCRPAQSFLTLGLDANLSKENGLVLTGGYHTRIGNNNLQDQVISFGAALSF